MRSSAAPRLGGGRAALENDPDVPPGAKPINLFWSHAGNREAIQACLRGKTELPGEIARDGQAGFRLAASA